LKKIASVIMLALVLQLGTVTVLAHPKVPEQSLHNVSANAAKGLHTAWGNIEDADGVASHVFLMRHSPH
jgi:hypothetical protein